MSHCVDCWCGHVRIVGLGVNPYDDPQVLPDRYFRRLGPRWVDGPESGVRVASGASGGFRSAR